MNHLPRWFGLMLACLFFINNTPRAFAQSPTTCIFVKETSHNIHGAFLVFYESHNGATYIGQPLTEAFIENGILVQYFTFARLEFHPTNPELYRVLVSLLGMSYNITDPPVQTIVIPGANDPNVKYFPETGLIIGFAIKDYWLTHGGIEMLGYPVSQLRYENGLFVQYFQRTRLEWNPNDTSAHKVRKSPVGQMVLGKKYAADFQWRARSVNDWCSEPVSPYPIQNAMPVVPASTSASLMLAMTMNVELRFASMPTCGPQYVDVLVNDRATKQPIPGVALYAAIQSAHGTRHIPLLATDERGKTSFSFDIGNQPAGLMTTVTVYAVFRHLNAEKSASFIHH